MLAGVSSQNINSSIEQFDSSGGVMLLMCLRFRQTIEHHLQVLFKQRVFSVRLAVTEKEQLWMCFRSTGLVIVKPAAAVSLRAGDRITLNQKSRVMAQTQRMVRLVLGNR